MVPTAKVIESINIIRRILMINTPGTTLLRAVKGMQTPYGAVMEYNNDSDACFDTKVVNGRVERGAKDPPGMGRFCHGEWWCHVFSEDELQYFTIPVAEFTASILNLFVTEETLDGAECIVMNIDALATLQALTTRASNAKMRAVHELFMEDDIFQRLVVERKCLAVRHVWGLGNACADAASRS